MKFIRPTVLLVTFALTLRSFAAAEYKSEVIPVKYAKASDIAAALNKLDAASHTNVSNAWTNHLASMTPRLQEIVRRPSSSGEVMLSGTPKVIADERSNSILVFAPEEEMESFRRIVKAMDVQLRQILIEAAIFEVKSSGNHSDWQRNKRSEQMAESTAGRFLSSRFRSFTNLVSTTGNSNELNYVAELGNGWDSTIAALSADRESSVRLLQKPRILTAEGQSASLFVGETVPSPHPEEGGPSCSNSSQLKKGFGLQVSPKIRSDGQIALQVGLTIDEVSGKTYIKGVGDVPNTSSTQTDASILVQDGEIIMIGAAGRQNQEQTTGIPVLRSIPGVRSLFRRSPLVSPRTEFLVLLRPTLFQEQTH
jgi:type II secretory pathway component GspD/PulD (secretin)